MAELPPDVRSAIESAEWEDKLCILGQKHALHIDQMGGLEDETLLVMLGFAAPEEFAANIAEQLHVPAEKAQVLALEVNTEVFLPIRESMKRFMEARANTPAPAPQAPAGTPATPPAPTPPPPPAPALQTAPTPAPKPVDLHTETILAEPTSSVVPAKIDPYREPVE